jgi:hypothetical protein
MANCLAALHSKAIGIAPTPRAMTKIKRLHGRRRNTTREWYEKELHKDAKNKA